MSSPCPWLAVPNASVEALTDALRIASARAPMSAQPDEPPTVYAAGRWAVAEVDVGREIQSWAQAVSDVLDRPAVAALADGPTWGFDVFEDGLHLAGMEASATPSLYGSVPRAAHVLRVPAEEFDRCYEQRVEAVRDLGAVTPAGVEQELLDFARALGIESATPAAAVMLPTLASRPSRWHGLLPRLEAARPADTYQIHEAGSGTEWRMALLADRMTLEDANRGRLRTVTREAFANIHEVFDGSVIRRTLVLRFERATSFRLSPAAFSALRAWMEPDVARQLARAIRRRLRWKLGFGLAFVLFAFTSYAGARAMDSAVMGGLGAGALGLGVLARVRPHRALFLLDGIWALAVAAAVTRWVREGELHHAWLAVVAFEMFHFMHGVRLFRFWGPRPPGPQEPGPNGAERG